MMDKSRAIAALTNIYQKSISEQVDYGEVVDMLSAIKVNGLVNMLVNQNDYDDDDVTMMALVVKILQNVYNNSAIECPIPDELYDQLYATMLSSGSPNIVGSDSVDNGSHRNIVYHLYPDLRGTLDKVHFITEADRGFGKDKDKRRSIEGFVNTVKNTICRNLTSKEKEITIFPKFDGVSVIFECDKNGTVLRCLTRGNTETNEALDITQLFGYQKFKPLPEWRGDPFAVKTEVVVSMDKYAKLCKKYGAYKSPRSAASSIINTSEVNPDFLKYITVVPLRMQNFRTKETIIHPDAYDVYPNLSCTIDDWDGIRSRMENIRAYMKEMLGIPIDGAVLYLEDAGLRETLGRDGAINKFEVAYKYPVVGVKSVLKDVDFSVGILGTITPVAKIEPVVIDGNTIRSVSLGSVDRFESLHLRVGDDVIVKYEIIPYLVKDATCIEGTGDIIKRPTHCKYCDEELIFDPLLTCANDECPSRMIGKIVNFLNKMDILNISTGIITTLFDANIVRCIEDLYKLDKHRNQILSIPGFGDKLYSNILKGIKSRNKVEDYVVLGAIGISGISKKIFKGILGIYNILELVEICHNNEWHKLTDIPGIAEKTANKILVGIIKNEELIMFLNDVLTIIPSKGLEYKGKILFSKVEDKAFKSFLKEEGYDVASGYSKSIDLLIVPSRGVRSDKIDKATADGKEIITLEEAYDRFKYIG